MKKLLLSCVAAFALAGAGVAALGQVNYVPQIGAITSTLNQNTFSAVSVGLAPASSATDIFCLNGSTSKTVHLDHLLITGTAGTAITTPVVLKLNHSLDTGGTPATGLALPAPAPNNSTDVATATLTAYTANPTVNDSTPNYLMAPAISFAVTTTANQPVNYYAGQPNGWFNKGWDIRPATTVVQQLCLNLNAVSISSGVLAISAEWTEQ